MPLAFWDWTTERGIPKAFEEETYENSNGRVVPNPLYHGILPTGQDTSRGARPNLNRDRLAATVSFAQSQDRFEDFTSNLESGTMKPFSRHLV